MIAIRKIVLGLLLGLIFTPSLVYATPATGDTVTTAATHCSALLGYCDQTVTVFRWDGTKWTTFSTTTTRFPYPKLKER
jgi:hypothetical protein